MIVFFIVIILLCIKELPVILKNNNKADIIIYIIMVCISLMLGVYYFLNINGISYIEKLLSFLKINY